MSVPPMSDLHPRSSPAASLGSALAWSGVALLLMTRIAGAQDWQVDPARSRIGFSGVQVGQPFSGRFTKFEATIRFDPDHPETGRAVVVIDLSSAETGDRQRDEALPKAEWFDVARNRQARFEATRFTATGANTYDASGSLEIRGLRRDVTLPFRLERTGDTAQAKGRIELVRTQFGVGQGPWTSGQWVALEVGVDIDIVAKSAP